jgi:hypothetical protein
MTSEFLNIANEFVKLIPSILWLFFVVVLLILFYRPIRDDLYANLTSLKAGGVELSFVKESIDAALKFETFSTPLRRIQRPSFRALLVTPPSVDILRHYLFLFGPFPARCCSGRVDLMFASIFLKNHRHSVVQNRLCNRKMLDSTDIFKSGIVPISKTSEI